MIAVNVAGTALHRPTPPFRTCSEPPRTARARSPTSSTSARSPAAVAWSGYGVYNLTKFGVNGFTESLRQEVTRRHVRVGVLEPGGVATELALAQQPRGPRRDDRRLLRASPRSSQPEDIADGIAYMVTRPRHASIGELWTFPPTRPDRPARLTSEGARHAVNAPIASACSSSRAGLEAYAMMGACRGRASARRGRRSPDAADEPRQGHVSRDGHDEGRGDLLLCGGRPGHGAARRRPAGHTQALGPRRRHSGCPAVGVLREELRARARLGPYRRHPSLRRAQDLPHRRRPGHAGVARAARRARAPRAAMAIRCARRARESDRMVFDLDPGEGMAGAGRLRGESSGSCATSSRAWGSRRCRSRRSEGIHLYSALDGR